MPTDQVYITTDSFKSTFYTENPFKRMYEKRLLLEKARKLSELDIGLYKDEQKIF